MADKDEILLDWAWRNLDDFWEDKRELDNKGSILLTANGIVLGFVANAFDKLNFILSILGITFLMLSIFFCIMLLKTHIYTRSKCEPIEVISKLDEAQLNEKIYNELRESYEKNHTISDDLVRLYGNAIYFFLTALLLIAFSIIAQHLSYHQ